MARPPLPLNTPGKIGVRKVGDKRFAARCRYRDPDGVTRRLEARGRSEAAARNELQAAIKARQGHGSDKLYPSSRFRDAAQLWMATKVTPRRSGSTRDAYRRRLDAVVLPALGELRLRECTASRLDAFMARLEQRGLSGNYRSAVRGVVREVCKLAVMHGVLAANPVDALDNVEGRRAAAPRALTVRERRAVLDWLESTSDDDEVAAKQVAARRRHVPDLARFLLATGARIGEACAVRWCDVDLDGVPVVDEASQLRAVPVVALGPVIARVKGRGLVRVEEGKTAAANRTVPLPGFATAMLAARKPDDAPPGEPVFPVAGRAGVSWQDPSRAGKYFREVFDAVGMEWATSHVCRKTYLTILDDEQALSDRMKADLMGHATLLRDTYVGRGELHPQAATYIDAAYRG
ncbi:MAG: tyrosine-type recombinase/integrase [Pseudonocardiaceae bacterium]|nr:tyrosine-type recombinase/integrase [Pseudonocardiaceae bacterium]